MKEIFCKTTVFLGLGYRPMPPDDYIESTLIWFKLGGKASEWKSWSDRVAKFLEREYTGKNIVF